MVKKFLAKFLTACLVLTAVPAMPGMDASADAAQLNTSGKGYLKNNIRREDAADGTIDCNGFMSACTKGYEVTEEGITIEFKSKSYDSATDNWHTPVLVGYTNTDAIVGGEAYKEYGVLRSDAYAINDSMPFLERPDLVTFDWAGWLSNNKAGVNCKVQAIKKDGKMYIEFTNDTLTTLASCTYDKESPVYISLSGEKCVISDIVKSDEFDESILPEDNSDDANEYAYKFDDFGSAHTPGAEVTKEGITLEFKNETYASATLNWHTPSIVAYSGKEGIVGGDGYVQAAIIRSDAYAIWNVDGYTFEPIFSEGENFKWEEWLARNKAGVDCKIHAVRKDDKVEIEFTNDTVTSKTTIPYSGENPFYISVTGERCKITNPADPAQLDCPAFQASVSQGYAVGTTGTAITFKSTTYDGANDNWNCPALIVYTAAGVPLGHGIAFTKLAALKGYNELVYMRGDNYGWGSSGYSLTSRGVPSDWAAFNEANRKGIACSVSAIKQSKKVVLKFVIGDLTEYISIPYTGDDEVYFSITGEKCAITDIAASEYKEITIPGQVVLTPSGGSSPASGGGSSSGGASAATPAPTLPPAPAEENKGEEDENKEEEPGIELDCGQFWTVHTAGAEITESGVAISFKTQSHSSATSWYQVPGAVVYACNEPVVNGAGYKEYMYVRADRYAWAGQLANANPIDGLAAWTGADYKFQSNTGDTFSFDDWFASNKAGTDCKVQAVKRGDRIVIEFTDANITTWTSFPVKSDEKLYLSLTGEECKLTDIKMAKYVTINEPGVPVPSDSPEPTATPEASAEPTATPGASAEPTTAPDASKAPATPAPDTSPAPGSTAGPDATTPPDTSDPDKEKPGDEEKEDKKTKKTMKVSDIKAKAGTKKVTGKVSVKNTKVQVKAGSKKYKAAKVDGRKFTFTASSKLKKGTKITIKITKSGYKTITKKVKVK